MKSKHRSTFDKGASPLIFVYIMALMVTLLAFFTGQFMQAAVGGLIMLFVAACEWYQGYKEEQIEMDRMMKDFGEY